VACGSGNVCARTGACLPASQVYAAHVTWTLQGMPAGQATCEAALDLEIGFYRDSGIADLGYAPVPCIEGKFSIDKLPTSDTHVRLGRATADHAWQFTAIDAVTGDAMLDLPF